jgi:hypothetical protein
MRSQLQPSFDNQPELLPSNAREGAVLSRTAAFVRSCGRGSKAQQQELILRVRFKDNPVFAFLEPEHRLHAFYVLVRDTDPQGKAASAREGLSRLLSAYDDDDDSPAGAEGVPEAIPEPSEAAPPSAPETASKAAVATPPPEAAPSISATSEPPAENAAIIDKTVAFLLEHGAHFEDVIRQRQAQSPSHLFDFLLPTSAWHTLFRSRLAAARAARPHSPPAARSKAKRWDVRPAKTAAPREPDAEPVAAVDAEEEARKAARRRKAREFGAVRAASVVGRASSAHKERLSSHRALLCAGEGDADEMLPDEEAAARDAFAQGAFAHPFPPPSLGLFRPRRAAVEPSIAEVRAAALSAAARARLQSDG